MSTLLGAVSIVCLAVMGCGKKPPKADAAPAKKEDSPRSWISVTILQEHAEAPVRYRLGDRETKDLDELRHWLVEARELAESAEEPVTARLYARNFTPHAEVVRVLNQFADVGFTKVDFFGGSDVSKRLLWPDSNFEGGG